MTEADLVRRRQAELEAIASRSVSPESTPGGAAMLVRTVTIGTYPTAVPRVFMVVPVAISVAESEGAVPTLTPAANSEAFGALIFGPAVPASGTNLVVAYDAASGLWVGRHATA